MTTNPSQNHGAAIIARRRRFIRSQFRQIRKPPNAGVNRMLPKIAMYGLQIVSPSGGAPDATAAVAGIVDPGPVGPLGNGGGPAAGIGIEGNGGGVTRCTAGFVSSVAAGLRPASDCGSASVSASIFFSGATALAGAFVTAGNAARNSEIGFQADFASSHARSLALRLPSATFSRINDSEKRPAYCPLRCTQISTPPI